MTAVTWRPLSVRHRPACHSREFRNPMRARLPRNFRFREQVHRHGIHDSAVFIATTCADTNRPSHPEHPVQPPEQPLPPGGRRCGAVRCSHDAPTTLLGLLSLPQGLLGMSHVKVRLSNQLEVAHRQRSPRAETPAHASADERHYVDTNGRRALLRTITPWPPHPSAQSTAERRKLAWQRLTPLDTCTRGATQSKYKN